jgi:ABC-type glycerol-3-phosphate transport system substrate-binding protein
MRLRTVISLLLPLSLVACDFLVTTVPPTNTPLTPIVATAVPTLAPTLTRDLQPAVTPLTLWVPEEINPYSQRPGAGVLAQQLIAFSETYPDLRVEVIVKKAHGRGGLLDFLRTARSAAPSVLPDLVILDAADLETAAASELIQPLDELLSPGTGNDRFAFATQMGLVNGQTMGFVTAADMQHLAYRSTLFDSSVITWTAVISAPAQYLFPAGGRDRKVNDATLIEYLSVGGTLIDSDGKPFLNRAAMVSVFTFYSRCIGTSVISPAVVLEIDDPEQAWELFSSGESDMAVVPASRYWLAPDETMAAAALPTPDGEPSGLISQAWAVALVTDDPTRQGLAMLLLDWLIASDHSAQWTQAVGYLPSTYGALQLWNVTDSDRTLLRDLLDVAVPPPRPDVMMTAGQVLQEALEALLRGRATPRQAANAAIESLGQ